MLFCVHSPFGNSVLYFLNPKPNFLKKELTLIYTSSDSSEEKELLKFTLICLIPFFSTYMHSFKNFGK